MTTLSQTLVKTLEERIDSFRSDVKHEHVGTVVEVGDGIAKIQGLSRIGGGERSDFWVPFSTLRRTQSERSFWETTARLKKETP